MTASSRRFSGLALIAPVVLLVVFGLAFVLPRLHGGGRTKASEAVDLLKAYQTAQLGYFQEFDRFASDPREAGAVPDGDIRYTYYFGDARILPTRRQSQPSPAEAYVRETEFKAVAVANFDCDTGVDLWVITETGPPQHVSDEFAEDPPDDCRAPPDVPPTFAPEDCANDEPFGWCLVLDDPELAEAARLAKPPKVSGPEGTEVTLKHDMVYITRGERQGVMIPHDTNVTYQQRFRTIPDIGGVAARRVWEGDVEWLVVEQHRKNPKDASRIDEVYLLRLDDEHWAGELWGHTSGLTDQSGIGSIGGGARPAPFVRIFAPDEGRPMTVEVIDPPWQGPVRPNQGVSYKALTEGVERWVWDGTEMVKQPPEGTGRRAPSKYGRLSNKRARQLRRHFGELLRASAFLGVEQLAWDQPLGTGIAGGLVEVAAPGGLAVLAIDPKNGQATLAVVPDDPKADLVHLPLGPAASGPDPEACPGFGGTPRLLEVWPWPGEPGHRAVVVRWRTSDTERAGALVRWDQTALTLMGEVQTIARCGTPEEMSLRLRPGRDGVLGVEVYDVRTGRPPRR